MMTPTNEQMKYIHSHVREYTYIIRKIMKLIKYVIQNVMHIYKISLCSAGRILSPLSRAIPKNQTDDDEGCASVLIHAYVYLGWMVIVRDDL